MSCPPPKVGPKRSVCVQRISSVLINSRLEWTEVVFVSKREDEVASA